MCSNARAEVARYDKVEPVAVGWQCAVRSRRGDAGAGGSGGPGCCRRRRRRGTDTADAHVFLKPEIVAGATDIGVPRVEGGQWDVVLAGNAWAEVA